MSNSENVGDRMLAKIGAAVERMRAAPFCDDATLLGTTQQDDRMRHYATVALYGPVTINADAPGYDSDGVCDDHGRFSCRRCAIVWPPLEETDEQ